MTQRIPVLRSGQGKRCHAPARRATKTILGGQAPSVLDALVQAFPNPVLYWQESKLVELLARVVVDFDIRVVFDVPPGSWALAEAALRLGICYVGVTTDATHTSWLGNALYRVAMTHLASLGRPMDNKEVAGDVNAHFGDVLVGFKEGADMDDVDVGQLLSDSV